MKTVCLALGLARSHVHDLLHRPDSWVDGRTQRKSAADETLLGEIRQQIAELPSYGYRRACALVNRARRAASQPVVNPKRSYRIMKQHGCCCLARRAEGPPAGRTMARWQ